MTDYKKYALGQVENFLYDAMSAEASPQEIYDVIKGVVSDNYYTYKHQASQAYELLTLLNGKETLKLSLEEFAGPYHNSICDRDDTSQECQNSWNSFWEESNQYTEEEITEMCDAAELERDLNNAEEFLKEDKVNKWIIPVDDDYNITFPEDLIEQTGWKEGDTLQWIDQGDGSFKMIKKEN